MDMASHPASNLPYVDPLIYQEMGMTEELQDSSSE